ncbi:hypothetical protein [Haloterrigena salifodinae]|uniref:hypothetical protein n=1 Tax=Haloterrigena salifodinae TaxID=2675099 RepID=UPI001E50E7E1|nr:hypothetical protein [Haloterrigena salifodinae]
MTLQSEPLREADDRPHRTEVTPDPTEKNEAENHNRRPPEAEKRDVSEIRPGIRRPYRSPVDRVEEEEHRNQIDCVLYVFIREQCPNDSIIRDGEAARRVALIDSGSIRSLVFRCHHSLSLSAYCGRSGALNETSTTVE